MVKIPAIGDEVYIPSINSSISGGLAKVVEIIGDGPHLLGFEDMRLQLYWEHGLAELQDTLRAEFGSKRAHAFYD